MVLEYPWVLQNPKVFKEGFETNHPIHSLTYGFGVPMGTTHTHTHTHTLSLTHSLTLSWNFFFTIRIWFRCVWQYLDYFKRSNLLIYTHTHTHFVMEFFLQYAFDFVVWQYLDYFKRNNLLIFFFYLKSKKNCHMSKTLNHISTNRFSLINDSKIHKN